MPRVLVTVDGPSGRHHLWLPEDAPLRLLLPAILQVTSVDRSARWRLTPRGGRPLDPEATLAGAGVLPGAILLLQPETGSPSQPIASGNSEVGEGAQPTSGPAPASPSPPPPGPGEGVVELVVRGGPGAGRRARLGPGEHRLGGHGHGPLALNDPWLAPVHLTVRVSPGGEVTVAPARPGLAVALDGVRLDEPRPVGPGERLALGQSLLAFEWPGRPAPRLREVEPVPGLRVPAPPARTVPGGALAVALGLAGMGLGLGGEGTPAVAAALAAAGLGGWLGGGWWRFGRARGRFRRQLDEAQRNLAAARRRHLEGLDAAAPDAPGLIAGLTGGAPPAPRRRHQPGWLRLRLGWADQPSGLRLEVEPGGSARLRAEAMLVAARHAVLPGAPVTLALPAASPLGLCGDRPAETGLARWLAFQVAVLHRPEDVVVCAALPETERDRWMWLARLPHADPARSPLGGPTLAFGPEEAAGLHRRLRQLTRGREAPEPALVAILDADLVPGGWDLAGAPAAGVHLVWLAAERLRPQCAARLELAAVDGAPLLEVAGAGPLRLGGVDQLADDLAHAAEALGGAPPSLLQLLGVEGEVERRVLEHWIRDRAGGAPRPVRALLGIDPVGRPVEVDLARPLLIVGSEVEARAALECLVASLAVRRSPRSTGILMVGDPGPLERLPHLMGVAGSVFGARERLEAVARGRELLVVVDRRGAGAADGLRALARRASSLGACLVVAAADDAVEPALGPRVRRIAVRSGLTDVPHEEEEARPPAGEEVSRLVAAVVAVARWLDRR